ITSLRDLATKPVRLVIGSDTLPVGSYTRTVLRSLDAVYRNGYASAVLGHVVSNEDSVTSILTKVEAGEADAGFVYVTDALAAGAAATILFGFVALPLLAIFLRVPASRLVAQLGSRVALQALTVSLRSSLIALALIIGLGTPTAYVLATRRFRGAGALTAL